MSATGLSDAFGRRITYLRVSVTDRCNLRCLYCMPDEGVPLRSHAEILRYEEIERLVRLAAEMGVTKVRVTGGEPLVRPGVADLVAMLARVPGVRNLALTTNGVLLAEQARDLAQAGLQRVNVSLDTLRPDRFERLARRGRLEDVLDGIEAAEAAGLTPVKLNMVVIRGLNDDEVVDFARLTLDRGWHVRFIEVMPLGEGRHWAGDGFVPSGETRAAIEGALGRLTPLQGDPCAPVREGRLSGAHGTIGFIAPVSEHFCGSCNRLRLTADGRLISCLVQGGEVDVRGPMRAGADDEELRGLFVEAVRVKPAGHHLAHGETVAERAMSGIGG